MSLTCIYLFPLDFVCFGGGQTFRVGNEFCIFGETAGVGCIYLFIQICIYFWCIMEVFTYVFKDLFVYTSLWSHIYVYMYKCIYIYINTYSNMYLFLMHYGSICLCIQRSICLFLTNYVCFMYVMSLICP